MNQIVRIGTRETRGLRRGFSPQKSHTIFQAAYCHGDEAHGHVYE
jgi:hypothetical protein